MHVNAWKAAAPAMPAGSPSSREHHHRSSSNKCHKPKPTCALVAVQADELHGTLVGGPAALTPNHMFPPRAVPECKAIASEGHLQGSTEHPPECRAAPSAAPQPLLERCPACSAALPKAGTWRLPYPMSHSHLQCPFLAVLLLLPTCVRSAGFK